MDRGRKPKLALPWILDFYLILYNSLQAIGWIIVLSKISKRAIRDLSILVAYDEAGILICQLQLAAFLEVIHAAAGLVNSGFFMSLLQWAGRSHVLFCIICQIEEIEKTSFVFMVFTAWSLSEVIRYPQYVLYMLGACPTWLTWIRYTAFIPLYPVGILGEVVSMYMALPYIQRSNLYGNLFELLPFGYYSLTTVLIAIYPFLWMPLYMHMFKRRHNKLTNSSMTRKKTAIKKS
ncbi:hypothetical protein O6H91_16G069200 [Diphasiastrum complanatum]|uniref:Uncharacterized protein n=1 Tax=Diphasiastrum complanatum TaxID=34168 RepID=A0ACC2BDD9_DIPCM|nr:hypothetical protein O6H91_16G069200 [Diphasiastrum complanatum]